MHPQKSKKASVRCRWERYWLTVGLGTGLSLVLIACGNKGPLRMPDKADPDANLDVSQQGPSVAKSNDIGWLHTQLGQSKNKLERMYLR